MQRADPRLLSLRDQLAGRVLQGTRGARYHVKERIGEGGQGWVFTASWDEPDGFLVIVKVLRPDAVTTESLARFDREAQVLRMLGQASRPNPHIVRFFDHAATQLPSPLGGAPIELRYTVLEYVRGPTLEQVLVHARGAGLALDRVRRIGRQITLALEDVHSQKVVHRDLKPSNVLLASEGGTEVAKVTDFGLVKAVEIGFARTTALAGASLGYAPPEQFEQGNKRVGPRTDVFSFAAILFEMITGARAFPHGEGENPLVIVTRLLNGPRPSLMRVPNLAPELTSRPDVVERLDQVLMRAMAAEPGDRHTGVSELWGEIEPLLRSLSERRSYAPTSGVITNDGPNLLETLETTAQQNRTAEADPRLANPAAWSWRVRVPSVRPGAARAAAFDPSGEVGLALGTAGLMRWSGGAWTRLTEPAEIDLRLVRGVTWLRAGEALVYGQRGLVAHYLPGQGAQLWDMPDKEVTFLGAHADPQGTVSLVGERPARRDPRTSGPAATIGTIAQFARGKVTLLSEASACVRLRGVTRLRSGVVVACGDWGSIVRLELGVPEHVGAVCGGHLHAIAPMPDGGAVTVGAGGHALSLNLRLQAQLEAVQTTRDLHALAVDASGAAWAGSAQARLLRRNAGSWVRMSGELGLPSSVVSLWVSPRVVRAVCDDGAIVEGVVV
jgi:serine/threonine-protein kinase